MFFKTIIQFIIRLIKFIISTSQNLVSKLETLVNKGKISVELEESDIDNDGNARFIFINPNLLDNFHAMKEIFIILKSNELFLSLDYLLIIFVTVDLVPLDADDEFESSQIIKSLHPNWLITQDTPFEEYYKEVSEHLSKVSAKADYSLERFTRYRVTLWNVDEYKGKSIKGS